MGFLPHDPFTQVFGATQSASVVHMVEHTVPEHMNGLQSTWPGAWQVPLPSHVPGEFAELPLHVGEMQVVSAS